MQTTENMCFNENNDFTANEVIRKIIVLMFSWSRSYGWCQRNCPKQRER